MKKYHLKSGKKSFFQSGLFIFVREIGDSSSFVDKYLALEERGLQITPLNSQENADFNRLLPEMANLETQYFSLYEAYEEEPMDFPPEITALEDQYNTLYQEYSEEPSGTPVFLAKERQLKALQKKLEKKKKEFIRNGNHSAIEEQINAVLTNWEKKKKELKRKCNHILEQIEDKFEILSASKEIGIDLSSVRTLISHPSGTKYNITQIVAQKQFVNQRGDYKKNLEISLQEEGATQASKFNVHGLLQQIETNNLYAHLPTLTDLKNSIFTTNEIIPDISTGMKFTTELNNTPSEFTVTNIENDGITLSTAVKPFANSDYSATKLLFGQFANFVNKNQFKPEVQISNSQVQEIREDTGKNAEATITEEGIRPYDEASGAITEENLTDIPVETSYFKELKENTKFYSIKDIIEFIKHIRANYKGNSEVLAEFRQGKLGEAMFTGDLKEHFKQGKRKKAESAIKEGAEKKLKSKPPEELTAVLRTSGNKYDLEVAFNVLSEQGFLNMWDPQIWANIFRVAKKRSFVPEGLSIDPNSAVCKKLYDEFANAVNKIWDDPNQFSTWERRNLTNCASKVSGVKDRANRIISSVGFAPHMESLLKEHMSPKKFAPVDPHEYEAMLLYALENGKGSIEERLYYLIMGLTLKDKKSGATVLTLERLSQINSSLHSKNVVLAFLNSSIPRPPEGKEHPITRKELEAFGESFLDKSSKDLDEKYQFKPNNAVKEFIWNTLISNPVYKDLATTEVRNMQNIDPSETQYYIPLASENLIKTTCITQGGIKIGMDGFANGFAGFSQYIKNMAQMADNARSGIVNANTQNEKEMQKKIFAEAMRNIKEGIKSYVMYEGILTDKFEEKPTTFIRLDHDTLRNRKVAGTNHNAMHYINELNGLVQNIVQKYNDSEYSRKISPIYTQSITDQKRKTQALRDFSSGFDNLIKDDNNRLLDTILAKNLTGIS
ncbi:MAG: hypothetical protein RBS56_04980 [Candidatus Gracilibacteria bacterium]|nr:hypothetical protein [Candidatus Gracilibacteria bacterium]